MDIGKTLKELYEEKKRLDSVITRLEARLARRPAKGRRGRKSMSPAERREVSQRMRRYWEARRAEKKALEKQAARAGSRGSAGESAVSA